MNEFVVEYLILMDAENAFCDNKKTFNNLMQVNSDVKINSNKLKYKNTFEVEYLLSAGDVGNKSQRFFQVSLKSKSNDLDTFVLLLKDIKRIVSNFGGRPEVLRDDISTYYSNLSYPMIHRIENLMRKLITNFMLRKIGKSWLKESSPDDFKNAVDKSKRKDSAQVNTIYQVDFIHLADFLFKPYSVKDVKELYGIIEKAKNLEELDLLLIKEYIPKSNWLKYFSDIVDCDDTFLSKRWSQLYELRCKVAHNSIVVKHDHDEIVKLVGEIENYLEKAIKNIDLISVPIDDKETVAESVMSNINQLYGDFIILWKKLDSQINSLAGLYYLNVRQVSGAHGIRQGKVPFFIMFKDMKKKNLLSDELFDKISTLQQFRNVLMHGEELFSDSDVQRNINLAVECLSRIKFLFDLISLRNATVIIDDSIPSIFRIYNVDVYSNGIEFDDTFGKPALNISNEIEFTSLDDVTEYVSRQVFVPNKNIEITFIEKNEDSELDLARVV
ncbi:hypothetical protein GCM10007978_20120 [Shewanella hanedai]|uniref:Uncharacterized protein n=1 Tax=Shewanella hanedai TaxID=25 RepID=A0A553JM67_SHEHA|nr:HEPN domain-containing protein [Shewanella hanedai]TRY13537.1 hypothetical protein FN961_14955 [Shewanella hanedai]GGI82301.1 hypothetical protein GCM10007978_20120 [Shewanella hanedai]